MIRIMNDTITGYSISLTLNTPITMGKENRVRAHEQFRLCILLINILKLAICIVSCATVLFGY